MKVFMKKERSKRVGDGKLVTGRDHVCGGRVRLLRVEINLVGEGREPETVKIPSRFDPNDFCGKLKTRVVIRQKRITSFL